MFARDPRGVLERRWEVEEVCLGPLQPLAGRQRGVPLAAQPMAEGGPVGVVLQLG